MQHFQFQTVGNIISGLGSISELKTVLTEKIISVCYWSPMLAFYNNNYINLF